MNPMEMVPQPHDHLNDHIFILSLEKIKIKKNLYIYIYIIYNCPRVRTTFSMLGSYQSPAIARAYFKTFFPTGFQNMHSDTKLTVKDATDANKHRQIHISATRIQWKMSRTRIRAKSGEHSSNFISLTRAILGQISKNDRFSGVHFSEMYFPRRALQRTPTNGSEICRLSGKFRPT